MTANYHTHTWRCKHAYGTEEEYIKAAIDAGIKTLGFSDHTPQPFPAGYYTHMRMLPQQLEDYANTVRALGARYQDAIHIPLGAEVEYYPAYFGELMTWLRDAGIEYMLLGQHWIGDEMGEPYCGRATDDKSILRRYCHQVCDAMQTGLFTYLAHPDLLHFTGSDRVYRHHMRTLCREAKSCGVPLEINMLGLLSDRHYPNRLLWEIAAEEGNAVVIGVDAHEPQHLRNAETEKRAVALAEEFGIHVLPEIALRPIG